MCWRISWHSGLNASYKLFFFGTHYDPTTDTRLKALDIQQAGWV
jgi:hypothetical protein